MMEKWQKQSLVLALTAGMLCTYPGMVSAAEQGESPPDFELDQVVVTATRTAKKIKDVPVVVEVITKEDIEKKNVQNVDDALKGISGVFVQRSTGINSSNPSVIMRGFDKGLLVLVDGQPQSNGYNNSVTWSQIPVENIERIEVVKGAGSALFGSGAQAGVINIITKSKAVNATEVKIGTGSQGTKKETFSHSGSAGKLDYFIDYSKLDSDGFQTAHPEDAKNYRGHQGGDQEHYSGKLVYHIDKDTKLAINGYKGESSYNYELGTDQGDQKSEGINLDFQKKVNDQVNYQITWGEQKTDKWYYYNWSPTAKTQKLMHQINDFKTNDGDAHVNWQLDPKNLLTLGYSLHSEEGTAGDERELTHLYSGNTWSFVKAWDAVDRKSGGKTKSNSVYFQDEHKLDEKFTAFIGGRYTNWETSGGWNSFRRTSASDPVYSQYEDREESNFSTRTGVVYKADNKTTWKLNVGQGFRTPTFMDLFRTSQSEIGKITTSNPDLKPEKSTSYDLNVDYQLDPNTLVTASYFHSKLTDAITTKDYDVIDGYVPNIGYIPGVTVETRKVNADEAEMKGFELGLKKKLSEKWSTYINYTYTDAQVTKSETAGLANGQQMEGIPKNMLNFGFDYKNKKWMGTLNGRKISDTKEDGSNSGKYSSYDSVFLVDTKVSYSPDKNSTISLSIDNLFDRKYWSYYLAPTRSTYLEYSYKF